MDRLPEQDLVPFAQSTGHVVIAFSPLAKGLLSGRYDSGNLPADFRATDPAFDPVRLEHLGGLLATLREVADAHTATPAQIALAWVIHHPSVAAIPGASSIEQLERNVAAAEIQLADDEYRALQAASAPFVPESDRPPRRDLSAIGHLAKCGKLLAQTIMYDHISRSERTAPAVTRDEHGTTVN